MTQLSYRAPSRQEIQALISEANQLRAETLKRMFSGLGRGIARAARAIAAGIAGLGGAIAEGWRAQRLYEQLSRMSSHELADIGLTRGDIPAVVAGIYRREVDVERAAAEAGAPTAEVTQLKPAPAAKPASDIRKAA